MGTRGKYVQKSQFSGLVEAADGLRFAVPAAFRGSVVTGDEVEFAKSGAPVRAGRLPEARVTRISRRGGLEIPARAAWGARGKELLFPANYGDWRLPWPADAADEFAEGVAYSCSVHGELSSPKVSVARRLGALSELDWGTAAAIAEAAIPVAFPAAALRDAEALEAYPEEPFAREDWTKRLVFTIDGEDAKDLDDAVSVEPLPDGGWKLSVHIADVASYVKEGSALDREAFARGTSVYLPDRVVPMLPERLSNGVCSLSPDAPKRCLAAVMELDAQSRVKSFRAARTLIHSRHRLTYSDVQAFLDGKARPGSGPARDAALRDALKHAEKLAKTLAARREREGKVDFDSAELKAWRDASGKPRYGLRKREFSHRLIEEFMVLANEQVAAWAGAKGRPLMYRVHPEPDADGMEDASELCADLGLAPAGRKVRAKDMPSLVALARKRRDGGAAMRQLLRCMEKAIYSPENAGHYGLGLRTYAHFTSPIRRYPDLCIHRAVHALLDGRKPALAGPNLKGASEACSAAERRADMVQNRVTDLFVAEAGLPLLGKVFDAHVTGAGGAGAWVRLADGAEGPVPFAEFGTRMGVDARRILIYPERFSGDVARLPVSEIEKSRKLASVWYLGKPVRVRAVRIDRAWGKVIFSPA